MTPASLRPVNFPETIEHYFEHHTSVIVPAFPNWQRSFVSGPQSPLFSVEHRIDQKNPHRLFSRVDFKESTEGPPGHVHGGASAALVDESMGILVWHQTLHCVTQTLQLSYLRALPLDQRAFVVTEMGKQSERSVEVFCTIYGKEKTPYVTSQGVFHRLTKEQLKKFLQK